MNRERRGPEPIRLVDDEVLIAMGERAALQKYGHQVSTALTGEEAVEMARGNPAIDGTQAAESILRDRDIPVVFLFSHMEPRIVERTERITSYG